MPIHPLTNPEDGTNESMSRNGPEGDQRNGPYGVHGTRRVIEEHVHPQAAPSLPHPSNTTSPVTRKITLKQGLKIAAGVAIVAVFGWVPLQSLLQHSSVEAVVNSRVVTLRAPIDGKISAQQPLSNTGVVTRGTPILHVANTRADRAHLDDLRRQLARVENDRPSLAAKLESARREQREMAGQAQRFKEGRILQLEARIAELQSTIEAATARREDATAAVERATSLAKSGNVTSVDLSRLTRDRTVAEQTEIGARKRLDASQVELAAAREGTFLGDSYNDRPSSIQREEEMRQRADTLSADIATADAEIVWLKNEIVLEEMRYKEMTDAEVTSPINGRIWEIMTSSGEDVRAGQPLLRILNCSGTVITANVTEGVYNDLYVGAKATFRPADGGAAMDGIIINLTGSAGAAANLAINPDALSKEPYRVTVSMPQLAGKDGDCAVGRTGRVIFTNSRSDAP